MLLSVAIVAAYKQPVAILLQLDVSMNLALEPKQ